MSKKASVDFMAGFRALEDRDGVRRHAKSPVLPPTETPDTPPVRTANIQQGSRRGKVAITQWVDPVVRKQLAQLALDQDRSQGELVAEAINLLFEKYGKSPIARP
jgi:hypothetical protein